MSNLLALLVALATLSLMAPAQAHYVWLERDGVGRHAPIWASGSTIRENSGDMLDRIKAPRVFLSATAEPVTIKRNEKNLEFQTQGRGDVRFVEDSMPSWRG